MIWKEGSKIREAFDIREYGASQIVDFCAFRDGCLIEFGHPNALERVSTVSTAESRIHPAVPFKEFTVDEGRQEEQKRILQQVCACVIFAFLWLVISWRDV